MIDSKPVSGESDAYRRLRNELLEAELALKDQRERVAELRRRLPPGAEVKTDYVFREGPRDLTQNAAEDFFDTRLSALFEDGKRHLIVDHMMFPPSWDMGCPMCSMWADGLDAVAPHILQTASLVLIARAPIEKLRTYAHRRGWKNLRLLSSHENTFNRDFNAELAEDRQLPAISIFSMQPDGKIHHSYTTEGSLVERHHRAMDLYSPVWNLLDLLPEGRGNWMPKHFYSRDAGTSPDPLTEIVLPRQPARS